MPRYRLVLEYDGAGFCGWQSQAIPAAAADAPGAKAPPRPSVQDALAQAVLDFCGETTTPIGAGRTDSGVHALGQVACIDIGRRLEGWRLREALNFHLRPLPAAVLQAEETEAAFHPRFDATARRYLYRISDRRAPLCLERGRAWHVPRRLDAEAMNAAAACLLGRHDFTTFRSVRCQAASPVKTLDRLEVRRCGDGLRIHGQARSFLYHQMRSMVGALKRVGEGKWRAEDVAAALAARERSACPTLAPAAGLYLEAVEYAPPP